MHGPRPPDTLARSSIDVLIRPDDLKAIVRSAMPAFPHEYQSDLFVKYTGDFIDRLPAALMRFDDSFYEVGTYLHKYFRWSTA